MRLLIRPRHSLQSMQPNSARASEAGSRIGRARLVGDK